MIKFHLNKILIKNEMTQKQLCEETGIKLSTILAITTGTINHIPIDVLNRICLYFDCQPNDIMEYIPDNPKSFC